MQWLRFVHKNARRAHPATHTHACAKYFFVPPAEFSQSSYHLTHTSYTRIQSPGRRVKVGLTHPKRMRQSDRATAARTIQMLDDKRTRKSYFGLILLIGIPSSSTQYANCDANASFIYIDRGVNSIRTRGRGFTPRRRRHLPSRAGAEIRPWEQLRWARRPCTWARHLGGVLKLRFQSC